MMFIILMIMLPKSICMQNAINTTNIMDQIQDDHDDVTILTECVLNLINTHFISTPTILMNHDIPNEEDTIKDEFDKELAKELMNINIPRVIAQDFDMTSIYMQEGHILSVHYVDDCETLSNFKMRTTEGEIKYLLIVFHYSKKICETTFQKFSLNISVFDVTFIAKNTENYNVFTFMPEMDSSSCTVRQELLPTILSSCSSIENHNAFPSKKLQNFMKCPFRVGIAQFFPFSTITNKSALYKYKHIEENEIHGSDLEILKIMAEKFNLTLEFYFITTKFDRRFLNFILNGTLDLCAGGLYRSYQDAVAYSGVYSRQAFIWIYAAKRDSRSWQDLIKKANGLYIFVVFYFVYSFIWKFFSIFDRKPVPLGRLLLDNWGALTGTSSIHEGTTFKQKILNIFYSILCIYLSAYVSIQMYSFLTIVSPPTTYKTTTAIVQSGLQLYLMERFKEDFINDTYYITFANTSKICDSINDCEMKTLEYNGVTVVIDSLFLKLQADTAVNGEAIVLRVNENLLTVYHEMLIRKDLPIVYRFQRLMASLRESGIGDRLYAEALGKLMKAKAESANKKMLSSSYSCVLGCSITLLQSAGAFYVWMVGCGLSFCVFIIEITAKRDLIRNYGENGVVLIYND
ncbi:uncharacterized protein LOC135078599 [Ostrinia nubilalis]|uniref:uncharacterized protein LOC135078599 n=1 Tax=Ostrinia nubilalis TaxID=29057 RepID=UPI003082201C